MDVAVVEGGHYEDEDEDEGPEDADQGFEGVVPSNVEDGRGSELVHELEAVEEAGYCAFLVGGGFRGFTFCLLLLL